MQRRVLAYACLFLLMLSICGLAALPASAHSRTAGSQRRGAALADFPTVDPNYIYDQLYYMATHYQHREAGYDDDLPVQFNGHDEFAAYWAQEMMRDLQGFGPQERIDQFQVQGWVNRPAVVPAFNVEITVPGVVHPEQVVVIGCHYDGEAVSTQSANDDASGCAIELGVAKAMGQYWRSHGVYPARTLRFVIFDAEEQGLYGSFHYLNSTVNGDVSNIVAMFNEEQSGIAYPLRYLGETSYPLLPFYAELSPLTNNGFYPHQDRLSQQQKSAITHFRALMQQAVSPVFAQFRALGYQALAYRSTGNQAVSQSIFTADQQRQYIHLDNDTLGGSDQIPFTLAGVPCATFVGNSTYYDNNPPPWSYPFDQKQDTIQLMNVFASGSENKAPALTLSLALPGMLTTWMLHQPSILGEAAFDGNPLAAISDIGQTVVSQPLALDAKASFEPGSTSSALSYTWNFGDDSTATGIAVDHTYTKTGTYTLKLTVTSAAGTRSISKMITVVTKPTSYANPYARYQADGSPPPNPLVVLPTPYDTKSQQTHLTTPHIGNTTTSAAPGTLSWVLWAVIGIVLVVAAFVLFRARRARRRSLPMEEDD